MANEQRRKELIAQMEQMGPVAEKWVEHLKADNCPMCGQAVNEADFKDDASRREFAISHICMKCQEEIFKGDDE